MRALPVLLLLCSPTWAGPKPAGYVPIAAGNRCLELSGTKLFSADCDGSAKQQWKLTALQGGYVQITSRLGGDGKCLDIINDGRANNRVTLAACGNASGQHWKLTAGHLTTEWRGEGKCLDIIDSTSEIQPLLADCSKAATQTWSLGASEASSKPAPNASFDPTFFIMFQNCAFTMPGVPKGGAWTMFGCTRATKQRAVCRVSNGSIADIFQPSRTVIEAAITTDTAKTLAFASTDDDISIRVRVKDADATLTHAKVACSGIYGTPEAVRGALNEARKQVEREQAQRSTTSDDEPERSAPAPSRSQAPSKPKGLAHGRMCGKDSECESGTCKMENRTRGRCS